MIHSIKSKDPKMPARIQLDPAWRPKRDLPTGALLAKGKLWDFTEKIAQSRREGKNRRDGATVSSRVLRLTDELGRRLFEETKTAKGGPNRISMEERDVLKRSLRAAKQRRRTEGIARL